MQEHTWNDRMHTLRQSVLPRPYNTLPAALLPKELLSEEKELQYLARQGGVCFARMDLQVCEDLFRICIAADPSRLDNNECSHLLFVSSVELRAMTEIFQMSAAIIP